ncbi:hypothetical protein F7725_026560, partial [Dissostichus mawsoni]
MEIHGKGSGVKFQRDGGALELNCERGQRGLITPSLVPGVQQTGMGAAGPQTPLCCCRSTRSPSVCHWTNTQTQGLSLFWE